MFSRKKLNQTRSNIIIYLKIIEPIRSIIHYKILKTKLTRRKNK